MNLKIQEEKSIKIQPALEKNNNKLFVNVNHKLQTLIEWITNVKDKNYKFHK